MSRGMWKTAVGTLEASARPLGEGRYRVQLGEQSLEVEAWVDQGEVVFKLDGEETRARVSREGESRWVSALGRAIRFQKVQVRAGAAGAAEGGDSVSAPMPGKVVQIAVSVGQAVKKGDVLVTVEAMKMEHALKSPRDGVVDKIACAEGDVIQADTPLVSLEAEA